MKSSEEVPSSAYNALSPEWCASGPGTFRPNLPSCRSSDRTLAIRIDDTAVVIQSSALDLSALEIFDFRKVAAIL